MKLYILAIIRLRNRLGKVIEGIGKKIEKIAYDPFGNTVEQYEKILELSDRKGRLINIMLMYDLLERELSGDELMLIARQAMGLTAGEIAVRLGLNHSTVYKRLCKALIHAEKTLEKAGFNERRLVTEYGDLPQVVAAINFIKNGRKRLAEEKKAQAEKRTARAETLANHERKVKPTMTEKTVA